jgi:hypothetical protein
MNLEANKEEWQRQQAAQSKVKKKKKKKPEAAPADEAAAEAADAAPETPVADEATKKAVTADGDAGPPDVQSGKSPATTEKEPDSDSDGVRSGADDPSGKGDES